MTCEKRGRNLNHPRISPFTGSERRLKVLVLSNVRIIVAIWLWNDTDLAYWNGAMNALRFDNRWLKYREPLDPIVCSLLVETKLC